MSWRRLLARRALAILWAALPLTMRVLIGHAQTAGLPADPPSVAPPAAVVAYVGRAAVAVGAPDSDPDAAEAATIANIVAGARVIGVGEPGHASREPLEYRNRLIRHLVVHGGLTAVALESGLADTRPVGDYVLGGPGDATTLVAASLSWGFGEFQANVDLVRWLRAWNAAHPARRVRFYGIDSSVKLVIGAAPELDSGTILHAVDAYLARALPVPSRPVRAALAPFRGRFGSQGLRAMDAAERARLQRALDDAAMFVTAHKRAMIAATSPDDYAWAEREAHDLRLLPDLLANWTALPPDLGKVVTMIRVRDRMMADNVEWALAREGPRERMLVFAANGHITAAPLDATIMRAAPSQPDVMGIYLRRRLGGDYRTILITSAFGSGADNTGIGSIDRAFLGARQPRALLNVRAAPHAGWWAAPQSLSQGRGRIDTTVPVEAADGLLFINQLSPAPTVGPHT